MKHQLRVLLDRCVDLISRPWVIIGLGVTLVLVPTVFTVVPEAALGKPLVPRAAILGCWLVAAVLVVFGGWRQGRQIEDLVGDPMQRRKDLRYAAGGRLTRLLLTTNTGLPEHYEFRLFVMDDHLKKLMPTWEPVGIDEAEGWESGKGATGAAWKQNELVVVRAEAVSDGTYGLTPDQQERYANLAIVAAMPVRNARRKRIGVLAASSETDDGKLTNPEGTEVLIELAEICSRILIDLAKQAKD